MSTILATHAVTEIARAVRIHIEAGNENPSFRVDYEKRLMDDKTGDQVGDGVPIEAVTKNYSDIETMSVVVPGITEPITGPLLFAVLVTVADDLYQAAVAEKAKEAGQ